MPFAPTSLSLKRFTSHLVFPALAIGFSMLSQAQAAELETTLAYNVGAVSDYRFRGITQTTQAGALQGGIDYAHKSGFYVGTFLSNVRWVQDFNGATSGNLELDLYGGYKGEIVPGLAFDIGAITYQYPGNNSGATGTPSFGKYSNANTTEIYGALTYSVATLKVSQSTGDFLGNLNSNGSLYVDLSATFDLGNGYTLTPHVGRQTIPGQDSAGDYSDYSLTLGKDMGNGFSFSLAATGTNASNAFYTDLRGNFLGNNTAFLGMKYTF